MAAIGLQRMLRGPAAAEQVFFILNRISDTQATSLEDYVESTNMLQCNKRKNL